MTIHPQTPIAVVGTPSSDSEVTLDLLAATTRLPLVGKMLYLTQPSAAGLELALGTVTEVITENQFHANPLLRGVVKTKGHIPGMSGDSGDVRRASIRIQAAYKTQDTDAPYTWQQAGPSLRMSPPTGAAIHEINDTIINELVAGETDLHYLGTQHGSTVKIPFKIRDFTGDRGAYHTAIFGKTGSGKTAESAYLFAGQFRHRDQGLIIVDPQGQWSSEQGLPFSLQGFATEMGRTVVVRRISEDLRLNKDAPLFGSLLGKTRFFKEIMKMSADTVDLLTDELVKVLRANPDWPQTTPDNLLDTLLAGLRQPRVLRRVYADRTKQIRLMVALSEVLGTDCTHDIDGSELDPSHPALRDYALDPDGLDVRRGDAMAQFAPLHNLFSATNPSGGTRHSMHGTLMSVFDRATRDGAPAPMLVLDMSAPTDVSWAADLLGDADSSVVREALDLLNDEAIQAEILRQTFSTLKIASEEKFRAGENLNTNVVFDEAWRYAPPPHAARTPETKALSEELAGYARDTRKFGIGWTYITQTTRSLNPDIWDQLSVRVVGYGLAGADVDKLGEQLDDRDHLKLYKGFSPPDSTNPRVYPFMITGPVSPLSFTNAPIFIAAYTDFDDFRSDNAHWISDLRQAQGLPMLTGTPTMPRPVGPVLARRAQRESPGRVTSRTQAQRERVREHAATGGVDPAAGRGLTNDPMFSDPLSGMFASPEDEPPF